MALLVALLNLTCHQAMWRVHSAEATSAESDQAILADALKQFQADCGRYPTTAEGLKALEKPPSLAKHWNGPYLANDAGQDPWAGDYHDATARKGFCIWSDGPGEDGWAPIVDYDGLR